MTPPTRADVAALLELSDERDCWLRRVLDAERRGFDRGRAVGYREGRADEAAERDTAWNTIARPIARGGPSHAELELRRWGPGGRARFGDPLPGDYRRREAS